MTLERIPLVVTPSQTMSVQLGQQSCRVDIRQRRTGVFVDLYVQDVPVFQGVKALDRCLLVRDAYLGFTGDLFFADMQGTSDPDYVGFADRFRLYYETA